MKYQISQKLLCLGDDFAVRDESGREAYYIDGKAGTFRQKLLVLDNSKHEVARIQQKFFSFTPTYYVQRGGRTVAEVRKKRFTFRTTFVIDIPGLNDYTIVGDLVGQEYTVKRGSRDVARVSKRFFANTDTYGVEIHEGDTILILCAVVVIDLVLHKGKLNK